MAFGEADISSAWQDSEVSAKLCPSGFGRYSFLLKMGCTLVALAASISAQSVPTALESPPEAAANRHEWREAYSGCRSFMTQHRTISMSTQVIRRSSTARTFTGWDADLGIWRVENGIMVGETFEGKPKGNNYIVYRGEKTKDFDLKLQMKIEKGGGGGIQYRSVTGIPWTRPQPAGQPPYDLKFMMTGPQADFWFPVTAQTAAYTGQWYSENTMQGILAYRGQVTQALPGQPNRLVANIGDKQALGGYIKVNEWNDYEVIARGGVMMHIMNGQLMAVFIDDNKDSVKNQAGLIGFEIESQPCKISVRDIWLRKFD